MSLNVDDLDMLLDEMDELEKVDETPKSEEVIFEEDEGIVETEEINNPEILIKETQQKHMEEFLNKRVNYSENFKETIEETRSFIKDSFEIESKIRELKEELKERKVLAKEEGVKISEANRAVKELIRELKETSEEAKDIEDMKNLIKNDPYLYSNVVEMSK